MIVGRTVSFRVFAMLPEAQPGPGQLPQPGNRFSRVDWSRVDWKSLAEGNALEPQGSMAGLTAVPDLSKAPRWERPRDPTVVTAYVPPSDSKAIFTSANLKDIFSGLKQIDPDTPQATARIQATARSGRIYCAQLDVAAPSRGLKPIAPDTAQVPAAPNIGGLPLKRVTEAFVGFQLSKHAYQTLYFSNTVPPDQLAALLQNYGALTPNAAQASATSLLSCLHSSAAHAVLYGLMATGAGIVLLEATQEKPTLSQAFWWAICSFTAGVLFFLGVRYLGGVK